MDVLEKWAIRLIFAALAAPFIVATILWFLSDHSPEAAAREVLNLTALPPSVSNLECHGSGIEDFVLECAGDAAPGDFPALMSGWPFEHMAARRRHPPIDSIAAPEFYRYQISDPTHGGILFQVTFQANTEGRFRAKLYEQ